jgi:CO/xanthine dehydrogenase Mo-binding subunit
VTSQGVRIFSGTQGAFQTAVLVATTLGLPVSQVRVTACAMGGCFGPGMRYSDTAIAAALMSQAVGAPVRVQLMRWDEIGWNQMDAATVVDARAGVDSKGNLVAIDFTTIRAQHTGVGTSGWRGPSDWPSGVLAGAPLPPIRESSAFAPASMYNVPNSRYTGKSIQAVGNWITHGALRTVTAQKVNFSGEQLIDELAHAAKMDPVAFRVQNVFPGNDWTQGEHRDELIAVLDAVTKAAGWQPKVSASNISNANVVTGRGVAWGNNYNPVGMAQAAAVADVEVNKKTGKVTVKHVWYAMSAGLAVFPDGIENQIVGGVTQGVSWVLHEQLRYSRTNVAGGDFVNYPILRFKDAPKVTPIVIQWGTKNPYAAGVGEPAALVVPAVVANAVFDATGVRMRTAPFAPAHVRAALKEAGTA